MRILAVDPGDRRIGIAISDPSGTIARALTTLQHLSRALDAAAIAGLAREHEAGRIIVGSATSDTEPSNVERSTPLGLQARKSKRLAEAVRQQTDLPVELWDEAFTTLDANAAMLAAGRSRKSRREHIDAVAAAILLQSYLDAHPPEAIP